MQTELSEVADAQRTTGDGPAWNTVRAAGLQRSLEALLFVASEALSIEALVKLTGASHVEVATTLREIAEEYSERGMVLREIAGGYRFATSPGARAVVEAYLLPAKTNLSAAAMETLAIVAYLQPATRAEIEAVRGVNVESVVNTLVDKHFIIETGRRDVAGRPLEYKTTPEFLESFGLRSLSELPPVDLEAQARELTLPIATEAASAATVSAQPGLVHVEDDEVTAAEAARSGPQAEQEVLVSNSSN